MKDWNTRKKRRDAEVNTNLLKELLKVINHFFPDFRMQLLNAQDPRKKNYITYEADIILLERILAYIVSLKSMNQINTKFNTQEAINNVNIITNNKLESLPHSCTINNFLKVLSIEELEKIRTNMIKRLLKMRCFDEYRYLDKYWKVVFDGSGIYKFDERHCEQCLTKTYNKGKEEEKTVYFHYVLEAKLIIGDMALSIATEFIENPIGEFDKQDCEIKAFYRLEQKLKKEYIKLPICIILDSAYACEKVFEICNENNWEYIIRFKDGSIKTVAEDFHKLKDFRNDENIAIENDKTYKYVNEIKYREYDLNIIECSDKKVKYPFRVYGIKENY